MLSVGFHLQRSENDTWTMNRPHFHDFFELMLPLTSPGRIFVDDKIYPLEPDTLYLIGENTLHRTIADGFHSRYVLHIGLKDLQALSTLQTDLTSLARDSFRCAALEGEQAADMLRRFQALEQSRSDGRFGSDLRRTLLLAELLLQAAQALNVSGQRESVPNKDFQRIAPILDYIREHLTEPLALDQIAGQFFISKHYLCRIFKSATGFSVMEYIIYNRILRARRLLQQGTGVQQAGELSGFSDNSHFIRTFGSLTGISPGRYAREYQNSDPILMQRD